MMTIITHVTLKQGTEPEWDEAMRARLEAAREEDGWIAGQLHIPIDRLDRRTIVGTWATRADWERWHGAEAFSETRERLAGLEAEASQSQWYECVLSLGST